MPRPREIVMSGITPEAAQEAAIKRAIELYSPYEAISPKRKDGSGWLVMYMAPCGGKREVVMDGIINKRTAKDFVEILSRSWVLGRSSAMLE